MELPRIKKIYDELNNPELQILAIEINDSREKADEFIAENSLDFIFAEADRVFVKEYFNTASYPNSFIIDRNGVIKQHHIGFKAGDEEKIKAELLEILEAL